MNYPDIVPSNKPQFALGNAGDIISLDPYLPILINECIYRRFRNSGHFCSLSLLYVVSSTLRKVYCTTNPRSTIRY